MCVRIYGSRGQNGVLFNFVGDREIGFSYVTKNGTGTGQIEVHIDTVDKLTLGK